MDETEAVTSLVRIFFQSIVFISSGKSDGYYKTN